MCKYVYAYEHTATQIDKLQEAELACGPRSCAMSMCSPPALQCSALRTSLKHVRSSPSTIYIDLMSDKGNTSSRAYVS
jgi:hypothetical protein